MVAERVTIWVWIRIQAFAALFELKHIAFETVFIFDYEHKY